MKNTSNHSASVITVNFNRSSWTIECIKSIIKSSHKNFRLILIDNGSCSDDFQNLNLGVKEFNDDRIKILKLETNVGYVKAINKGLNFADELKTDYILILNNDTVIHERAIEYLIEKQLEFNNSVIVSGKVFDFSNKSHLQYIGQYHDKRGGINNLPIIKDNYVIDKGQYDLDIEVGMLDDIFWLFPLKLYHKIGGYSPYFYLYGEQNDYALRAINSGYRLIYTPKPKIWHKGGVTTCDGNKEHPKIIYWKKLNTLKLAFLHLSKHEFNMFYLKSFFYDSFKGLIKLLIFRQSLVSFKAHIYALRTFNHWKKIKYEDNGFNPFN